MNNNNTNINSSNQSLIEEIITEVDEKNIDKYNNSELKHVNNIDLEYPNGDKYDNNDNDNDNTSLDSNSSDDSNNYVNIKLKEHNYEDHKEKNINHKYILNDNDNILIIPLMIIKIILI